MPDVEDIDAPMQLKLLLERDVCAIVLRGGADNYRLASEHVEVETFDSGTWRKVWRAMGEVVASGEPLSLSAVGSRLHERDELKSISYRDVTGLGTLLVIERLADELPAAPISQARKLAWMARERRGSEARIKAGARLRLGDDVEEVFRELRRDTEPPDAKEDRGPWNWMSAREVAEPLPPIQWLCEGLRIAPGAAVCFAGYGYSRKTLAAQALGLAVMAGVPVWGVYRVGKGRLVHLDYEQGRYLTRQRYQRLARAAGVPLGEISEDALRLTCLPPLYLDARGADEHLARLCDGATMLIVDSLRAAYPSVDENSSDVRRHIDMLSRVSERTGCTSVFIHHARKPNDGDQGGAKTAIRGSTAIFDACQSVFVFAGEKGAPTRVKHEKERLTGCELEDFGLDAEDVDVDGVHHAGLRVVHLDLAQLESGDRQRSGDPFDAYVSRVLEMMKAHPGCTGNVLFEHVGGRKTRFLAALDTLEASNRAVQIASDGSRWPTWRAV